MVSLDLGCKRIGAAKRPNRPPPPATDEKVSRGNIPHLLLTKAGGGVSKVGATEGSRERGLKNTSAATHLIEPSTLRRVPSKQTNISPFSWGPLGGYH